MLASLRLDENVRIGSDHERSARGVDIIHAHLMREDGAQRGIGIRVIAKSDQKVVQAGFRGFLRQVRYRAPDQRPLAILAAISSAG